MQEEDDPFDDETSFAEPLHPDDRLWRHPSEIHKVPAPGARSIPDTVHFAPVSRGRSGWTIAIASGLVGASAALLVVLATGMTDRVVERQPDAAGAQVTVTSTVPISAPGGRDASAAISAVMPSVVQIAATTDGATVDGSALVVREDGYLLTDAHVLDDATEVRVTFADQTTAEGEVIAIDHVTALAIVKVDHGELVPAPFGDPSALEVGQLTLAIGTNTSGGPSISSGVISAFDERSTAVSGTYLYGLIRFDAPLPDGAAGGPLVTEDGEVIGVTIRSDPSAAFGWATPIDDAFDIATQLIDDGKATHAYLGVEGRRTAEGAAVMSVAENSPAAEAGIQVDDILVSVDGRALPSMAALVDVIRDHEPGDNITITYRRDGIEWTCVATLGLRR